MATVRKYGIDVSYYQGTINWQAVKAAGIEWVILRAGYGNSDVDTKFVNNITGAVAAGITDIGVYWFSYAYDTYTANVEVAKCLQTIEPYRQYITLPVFFDWEEASYSYVERTQGISLNAAAIQHFATQWCNGITAAGYTTGIYSNKSNATGWFKRSNGQYLWEYLNCEFWYARYGANNEKSLFIVPAFEQTALSEHPETKIYQYSDVGEISGINSQRVDLNIRYVDEPTPEPPVPPEPPEYTINKNAIEYVEIRNSTFELIGILDTAQSVIWHSVYYGVGDFEIYVSATPSIIELLHIGNYITRPNDLEIGIVEQIQITETITEGKMIAATGRFAKSILDRRHIYNISGHTNTPTIMRGNVETKIRQVIYDNAINCTFDNRRNIAELELGAVAGITKIIVDEAGQAAQKQVSYQNLLEYTDGVLQEYEMASLLVLNNNKLQYCVYEGTDRAADNTIGNVPVVFSKEFDNLTDSTYEKDTKSDKNAALIGGAGEDLERFYSVLAGTQTGLARREMWVDAGSINRTYKDGQNVEHQYTDTEYTEMLNAQGKQNMSEQKTVETFDGTIDISNGNYVYNRDFTLGDLVTVQDNDIGKYIKVRILEVTEVQSKDGYLIDAKYGI